MPAVFLGFTHALRLLIERSSQMINNIWRFSCIAKLAWIGKRKQKQTKTILLTGALVSWNRRPWGFWFRPTDQNTPTMGSMWASSGYQWLEKVNLDYFLEDLIKQVCFFKIFWKSMVEIRSLSLNTPGVETWIKHWRAPSTAASNHDLRDRSYKNLVFKSRLFSWEFDYTIWRTSVNKLWFRRHNFAFSKYFEKAWLKSLIKQFASTLVQRGAIGPGSFKVVFLSNANRAIPAW